MRPCAADFVARITARSRIPLDYSVAGLRIVDFLIDGLRKGGTPRERNRETLLGLGAYVGEVLVRRRPFEAQGGARAWRELPPMEAAG